jgi:hypothetical protein
MTYIIFERGGVYSITAAQHAAQRKAEGGHILHTTTSRDEAMLISGWLNRTSERVQIYKWRMSK